MFGQPLPPGNPKAALAAGIGMVHQHFTLADNLSVLDNVLIGTEPLWRPLSRRREARARLLQTSRQFGLTVNPDARIADLSVGERQRVEILKALYRGARILILDEPTAVLTPQEVEALFATLKTLVADGLSIIFISHKLDEVLAVSQRVAVLRQGKLVAMRDAAATSKAELAELMVGRRVDAPVRSASASQGGAVHDSPSPGSQPARSSKTRPSTSAEARSSESRACRATVRHSSRMHFADCWRPRAARFDWTAGRSRHRRAHSSALVWRACRRIVARSE